MSSPSAAYRSSPTKHRRSRADIAAIKDAIIAILREEHPATVRGVFYQLEWRSFIAKTEAEYKQTVCRLLAEMRLERAIPFSWIADNTRWMRKPTTYGSALEAVRATARYYRQAIWRDQDEYVEVWLEKEALAGVLVDVTEEYDVPLMVTKGYPSLSFLYSAATTIVDPSGLDIARNVEERLAEFAPDADITFERFAVTRVQVDLWNLPTRPTKTTDSRSRGFQGESVEVDAIRPSMLRAMVRSSIEDHLPDGALDAVSLAEESERSIITNIINAMGNAA